MIFDNSKVNVIDLKKSRFKISCGHFTILNSKKRENLHGHDYFLSFRLHYSREEFVDYADIKNEIEGVCSIYDEKILLPDRSKHLQINSQGVNIEARFLTDFFSFPEADVLRLPIENITIEELCRFLFEQIVNKKFVQRYHVRMARLKIENNGQASYFGMDYDE